MRCKYLPQDLEARLHGGIAFYNKEPVKVIIEDGRIVLYTFPDMKRFKAIEENDELFDISAPRLGYVNYNSDAIYVYRIPERRYKQTLTISPLRFETKGLGFYPEDIFESFAFKKMLLNEYPSLNDALKSLEDGANSRAITRDLAIKKNNITKRLHLFVKDKAVGKLSRDNRTFEIKKGLDPAVIDKFIMPYWRS